MSIFTEQLSRKPDLYPWTEQLIESMHNGFWTTDVQQYKTELTQREQDIIARTLSAIGQFEAKPLFFVGKEQFIHIDKRGNKFYYSDREMTTLHRGDGPAIEWASGTKAWYLNGKYHREDGPAIEWSSGSRAWYINGELHREDGPAVEWDSGGKEWYLNDKRHREDGPAYEDADGYKAWYLNDKFLTEEEFNERVDPPEITLTLDEIASKFGVSVSKLKIKK